MGSADLFAGITQSSAVRRGQHRLGRNLMAARALARRGQRSPTFWVLATTLVPALILTPLARVLYQQWWELVGYFWYSIPANTFVYLPHEPAVIYAGAIYDAWLVALVGGLSTVVASIVDYFVIRRVFEFGTIAPIKETYPYKTAVRYFNWRPWATIVVWALTPLPYAPIRILAPSSGYPLWRYVSANVTGRVGRYYLLAMGAGAVSVPPAYLLLMVGGLFVVPLLAFLWTRQRARAAQTDPQ